MIYAIEAIGSGFIKFGKAKSVGRRLGELDTSCPHELTILAVADWPDWPDGAETAIHKYLEPMHAKGEWFKDSQITREVIAWMVNGAAGLERLHKEMPVKASRSRISYLTPPAPTKRRLERKAWWKAQRLIASSQ